MFETIMNFFKKSKKVEEKTQNSKNAAKERLHLVLTQDRANVSADFLELMKQEIIEVIKKYIEIDESAIDVKLTKETENGIVGAPTLYANIPILNIKNEARKIDRNLNKNGTDKKNIKNEDSKIEKKKKKNTIIENKEKVEEKTENEIKENEEKSKKESEKEEDNQNIKKQEFDIQIENTSKQITEKKNEESEEDLKNEKIEKKNDKNEKEKNNNQKKDVS